jgi:hypothetical protein
MGWQPGGAFNRLYSWSSDAAAGFDILADRMDQDTNDIVQGIMRTRNLDGYNAPTVNLPMGGFKHTNVGAAVDPTDYARFDQILPITGGTITGAVEINSTLLVTGALTVSGGANVSSGLTVSGPLSVGGDLGVSGNGSLAGTLTMGAFHSNGPSYAYSFNTAADLSVGGNFGVNGTATFSGPVNFSGQVVGTAQVLCEGGLYAAGVGGATGGVSLYVNGSASILGGATIDGDATIDGTLTAAGNATVAGTLTATGNRVISQGSNAPSLTMFNTSASAASGLWVGAGGLDFGAMDGAGNPLTTWGYFDPGGQFYTSHDAHIGGDFYVAGNSVFTGTINGHPAAALGGVGRSPVDALASELDPGDMALLIRDEAGALALRKVRHSAVDEFGRRLLFITEDDDTEEVIYASPTASNPAGSPPIRPTSQNF